MVALKEINTFCNFTICFENRYKQGETNNHLLRSWIIQNHPPPPPPPVYLCYVLVHKIKMTFPITIHMVVLKEINTFCIFTICFENRYKQGDTNNHLLRSWIVQNHPPPPPPPVYLCYVLVHKIKMTFPITIHMVALKEINTFCIFTICFENRYKQDKTKNH